MTFLGWVNFYFFQWFGVRLAFEEDYCRRPTGKWRFIKKAPMEGWSSYRELPYVLQTRNGYYHFKGDQENPMNAHRYTRKEARAMPFGIIVRYEKALEAYVRSIEDPK